MYIAPQDLESTGSFELSAITDVGAKPSRLARLSTVPNYSCAVRPSTRQTVTAQHKKARQIIGRIA